MNEQQILQISVAAANAVAHLEELIAQLRAATSLSDADLVAKAHAINTDTGNRLAAFLQGLPAK